MDMIEFVTMVSYPCCFFAGGKKKEEVTPYFIEYDDDLKHAFDHAEVLPDKQVHLRLEVVVNAQKAFTSFESEEVGVLILNYFLSFLERIQYFLPLFKFCASSYIV